MNTQLNIMKVICSSIIEYAEKYPGALDDNAKAELQTYDAKLAEFLDQRQSTKRARVDTKRRLDLSADDLRRAVVQSRKALESFAVGVRKAPLTPRATAGMWLVSRIYNVAVKHQEALAGISGDPVISKAAETLKVAMEKFSRALAEADAQQVAWKSLNQVIDEDLATIAGKLVGYKQFAVYNMPRTERRNLRDQIRSVVQAKTYHKKAAEATTVTAAQSALTVAPVPSLPAMPTVVPPSSEHPVMSATA